MSVDFDSLADSYDATRSFAPELLGRVARGVLELLGEGATLIDIGTGTGRFLLPIIELHVEAYGLDISQKMLLKGQAKGAKYLIRGEASSLPFKNEAFDGALMINLLHLVHDWRVLLREVSRVSKKAVISLDMRPDQNDPIRLFKEIIAENGEDIQQLAPRENELADICEPDRKISLGEYEEKMDRREVLSALRRRSYTFQASFNERLNYRYVAELQSRLKEDPIISQKKLTLIVWKPKRLLEFADESTFCYPQ